MSQLNTNTIKGVQDNDDVVIKTNNTTRVTIASGGDTFVTALSAPSVSAINTAKAWCFWGHTASDHDADASFNVSSVTDSGAGHSTINFAIAMPTVNYVVATCYNKLGGYDGGLQVSAKATGSCQLKAWYGSGGGSIDVTDCNAVFYSN